jgi:hypothetical protein
MSVPQGVRAAYGDAPSSFSVTMPSVPAPGSRPESPTILDLGSWESALFFSSLKNASFSVLLVLSLTLVC